MGGVGMGADNCRHMDDAEIERYSRGTVTDTESDRFEEHLLLCESCQERVAECDEVRGMRAASTFLRQQEQAQKPRFWFLPRWIPILAAVVVLLAVAAVVFRSIPGRPATPFAVGLTVTRGVAGMAKVPALRPLVLSLDVSGLPTQSFRIDVVNSVGRLQWQGSAAASDSITRVAVPGLRPGFYFVRAYTQAGEMLREFGLEAAN